MKNIDKIHINQRAQSGFTLIELMIVISMIAILSAIAVPSYKKYIRENAESEAVAKVKSLELELERWKATALTYRGFIPTKSTVDADGEATLSHAYDDSDNKTIYVPEGSTSANYLYKITLDDGSTAGKSLTTANDLGGATDISVGSTWRMIAVPNTNKSNLNYAEKYFITSRGVSCKTSISSVSFDSTKDAQTNCTQNGVEKW